MFVKENPDRKKNKFTSFGYINETTSILILNNSRSRFFHNAILKSKLQSILTSNFYFLENNIHVDLKLVIYKPLEESIRIFLK